ncbi:MAG: carbohydrate kinase family protein [Rhodobacteraceae bacterium]|nr:carbohydrate kinase family protein [Paracoccaceae bacterium]
MAAQAPELLCVGDIDMDLVIRVPHLPGRDEKISGDPVARAPGGMAANVAVGANRLGTPTRLVGAVGDDAMGREALGYLAREGVDLSHVETRAGAATFFCVILLDESGEKALVRAVSDTFLPDPARLRSAAFKGIRHVHMTFTDPVLSRRTVALAQEAGAGLSLDLEAADWIEDPAHMRQLVDAVDLLFTSATSRAAVEARLGPLTAGPGKTIVTTAGAEGAMVEHAAGTARVDGHRVDVVDTLGAGDAFAAAFLHSLLGGAAPADALGFANAAAALSVRAYGAQTGMARPGEVERLDAQLSGEPHHA